MKVGEIIWRYLQAEKIPARRVALSVGVKPSAFYAWMQGKCEPDVNTYARICETLGVPFEEFLDHKPGKIPVEVESGGEKFVKVRMDIMLRRDHYDCAVEAAQEMGYQRAEHLIGSLIHFGLQTSFPEQLHKQLEGYRAWNAHKFRQEVIGNGDRL